MLERVGGYKQARELERRAKIARAAGEVAAASRMLAEAKKWRDGSHDMHRAADRLARE